MNKPIWIALSCTLIIILSVLLLLSWNKQEYLPPNQLQSYLLPQFRQPPPSYNCNTTIVSAFYKISSKHSYEEYLSWMINFLSLRDCMVIFVQPDLVETISALRPPSYSTLLLPRPLNALIVKGMLDDEGWEKQEKMDPQHTKGHNRELFWIWNEKTNMMKMVADINPFLSSYFVWLDIGAVRHSNYNHQQMVKKIPEQQGILLLSIEPFTLDERVLKDGKSHANFSLVDRIGGGTIGSDKTSLERWHKAYYSTMRHYLESGRFIGKDQSMMATTCLETELCLLIKGDKEWFRMQQWFRGEISQEPKRLIVTEEKLRIS